MLESICYRYCFHQVRVRCSFVLDREVCNISADLLVGKLPVSTLRYLKYIEVGSTLCGGNTSLVQLESIIMAALINPRDSTSLRTWAVASSCDSGGERWGTAQQKCSSQTSFTFSSILESLQPDAFIRDYVN